MTIAEARTILAGKLVLGDPDQMLALKIQELHAKILNGEAGICAACDGSGQDILGDSRCDLCEGRGLLDYDGEPWPERVPLDVRLALRGEIE